MDVIRSLPAALDKLAENKKKSGGKRALMDNTGLGKPCRLSDNDPDGKSRMWAIRTEDFDFVFYGGDFREIMRWAAEQEHPLDDTEVEAHGNLCAGNLLDMAYGDQADASDQYEDLKQQSALQRFAKPHRGHSIHLRGQCNFRKRFGNLAVTACEI